MLPCEFQHKSSDGSAKDHIPAERCPGEPIRLLHFPDPPAVPCSIPLRLHAVPAFHLYCNTLWESVSCFLHKKYPQTEIVPATEKESTAPPAPAHERQVWPPAPMHQKNRYSLHDLIPVRNPVDKNIRIEGFRPRGGQPLLFHILQSMLILHILIHILSILRQNQEPPPDHWNRQPVPEQNHFRSYHKHLS